MIIDFRLKVFQTVARHLSFTKAAELLYVSQPSVTKHINELEKSVGKPLFNRLGRKISLTKEGEWLLKYANDILQLYNQLNEEIEAGNQALSGSLRLGASTTVAQYILPPILAQFKKKYPEVEVHLSNENTQQVETFVRQQKVDIGIIEGQATNKLLQYEPFIEDEIVLVTRPNNPLVKYSDMMQTEDLKKIPLLLREKGSGTLAVLLNALNKKGISEKELKIEMELGSTESLKNYVNSSDVFAFVSIHTILQELADHRLKVVDIEGLDIRRTFQFVSLHGEYSRRLTAFKKFCRFYYNLSL